MDNLINKKECVRVVVALHCCTWGIQPTNMGVQKQPFYWDILMGILYIYNTYIYILILYIYCGRIPQKMFGVLFWATLTVTTNNHIYKSESRPSNFGDQVLRRGAILSNQMLVGGFNHLEKY